MGLFGGRAYDSVSVDDLLTHLGVHRNSRHKTFSSERGLYLAALRQAHAGRHGRAKLPGVDHLLHNADHPDTNAPPVRDALRRFTRR